MAAVEPLVAVTRRNDRRESLEALRDLLAGRIDRADEAITAPLANQLVRVLAELDAMPVARERNPVNEIAERAAQRKQAARLA